MRRKGLLMIGLALLIAAAGVVYAHWTETLNVNAQVDTGNIDVIWQESGTDDDGLDNTSFMEAVATNWSTYSASDDGGGTEYDHWGESSSDDPAEMWRCGFGECGYKLDGDGLNRYDKDVAKCTVAASEDQKTLTAAISNAYPSYHCTVFSQLSNEGSVPVKMTAFYLTTPGVVAYVGTEYVPGAAGTTEWCNLPENVGKCPSGVWVEGVPVFTFDFADGTTCGHQLDPYLAEGDDMDLNAVWFHVEQTAEQGAEYSFSWQYDFVNWNEWDPSMCTVWINGICYGAGCPTVTTNGNS